MNIHKFKPIATREFFDLVKPVRAPTPVKLTFDELFEDRSKIDFRESPHARPIKSPSPKIDENKTFYFEESGLSNPLDKCGMLRVGKDYIILDYYDQPIKILNTKVSFSPKDKVYKWVIGFEYITNKELEKLCEEVANTLSESESDSENENDFELFNLDKEKWEYSIEEISWKKYKEELTYRQHIERKKKIKKFLENIRQRNMFSLKEDADDISSIREYNEIFDNSDKETLEIQKGITKKWAEIEKEKKTRKEDLNFPSIGPSLSPKINSKKSFIFDFKNTKKRKLDVFTGEYYQEIPKQTFSSVRKENELQDISCSSRKMEVFNFDDYRDQNLIENIKKQLLKKEEEENFKKTLSIQTNEEIEDSDIELDPEVYFYSTKKDLSPEEKEIWKKREEEQKILEEQKKDKNRIRRIAKQKAKEELWIQNQKEALAKSVSYQFSRDINFKEREREKIYNTLCFSYFDPNIKNTCGDNCRFAHDLDEFVPQVCNFNENCTRLFDLNKPCTYIHNSENKEQYIQRINNIRKGIFNLVLHQKKEEKPKHNLIEHKNSFDILSEEVANISLESSQHCKRSKACNNYKSCTKESCDYAHTLEEYQPTECNYGDSCKKKIKCKHLHPRETKEEIAKRLMLFGLGDEENEQERKKGFEILADKDAISKIAQNNKRSKFCNIFLEKGNCYRKACNYAHSIKEFAPIPCVFKEGCKRIYKKGDVCPYIHPGETIENYLNRNNITISI
jgi:hypothetical protein